MTIMHDIALATLRRLDLHSLSWRHHGLGMLQAELSDSVRVHIFHPSLVVFPAESFRNVHDHRFDLTSTVVLGALEDTRYNVIDFSGPTWRILSVVRNTSINSEQIHPGLINTQMHEIVNAKAQRDVAPLDHCKTIGPVYAQAVGTERIKAGDTYIIPRRLFHSTRAEGLTVTLVHRGEFDDRPARVLGERGSAIQPRSRSLEMRIVDMAVEALGSEPQPFRDATTRHQMRNLTLTDIRFMGYTRQGIPGAYIASGATIFAEGVLREAYERGTDWAPYTWVPVEDVPRAHLEFYKRAILECESPEEVIALWEAQR